MSKVNHLFYVPYARKNLIDYKFNYKIFRMAYIEGRGNVPFHEIDDYRNTLNWICQEEYFRYDLAVRLFDFKENLKIGRTHQAAIIRLINERYEGDIKNLILNVKEDRKKIEKFITQNERANVRVFEEVFDMVYNDIFNFWEPKTFLKRIKRGEHKDFEIPLEDICDFDIFLYEDEWKEYFKFFKKRANSFNFMIYFFCLCERKFLIENDPTFHRHSKNYLNAVFGRLQDSLFSESRILWSNQETNIVPRIHNINSALNLGANFNNYFNASFNYVQGH